MSTLNSGLVIDTLANGPVTTSLVCLNCPLSIYGKDFGNYLICLPLEDMDVIMGVNWLEFNHFYISCYNKTLQFLAPEDKQEDDFISAKELKNCLKMKLKHLQCLPLYIWRVRRLLNGYQWCLNFQRCF